jgi:hypothetical protein
VGFDIDDFTVGERSLLRSSGRERRPRRDARGSVGQVDDLARRGSARRRWLTIVTQANNLVIVDGNGVKMRGSGRVASAGAVEDAPMVRLHRRVEQ